MGLLLKWLIMAASIIIAAYFIPGVRVGSFFSALWVALFLGVVNILVRPVLILITLPINILTLGLFTFVINAVLVLLASSVIKGFEVAGFWWALLYSVVLSLVNYVINLIVQPKEDR
ncbi:MAG TPA: phage holin family protein [Syntrophorhabdaceae bacterium]|jgi:putative membrane protein|nr:phage holin family protein [Syntrophorhabdaceae bacterium]